MNVKALPTEQLLIQVVTFSLLHNSFLFNVQQCAAPTYKPKKKLL